MNFFTFLMNDVSFAKHINRPTTLVLSYDDGRQQLVRSQKRRPPRLIPDAEKTDREVVSEVLYNIATAIITVEYPRQISWEDDDTIKTVYETWSKDDYDRTRIQVNPESWAGITRKNASIIDE